MESLLFLLMLIGVAVIIHWSIINDKVPLYGKTKGLLSMNDAGYETLAQQAPPPRRGWRGGVDRTAQAPPAGESGPPPAA